MQIGRPLRRGPASHPLPKVRGLAVVTRESHLKFGRNSVDLQKLLKPKAQGRFPPVKPQSKYNDAPMTSEGPA